MIVLILPNGFQMNENQFCLDRLFKHHLILDIETILKSSGNRSRRSVFRDLASLGYLTSYTHAGSYYTLTELTQFDEYGLWFHKGVGFSRTGTLKKTLAYLIENAEAGHIHRELSALLRIRVHNALLNLVKEKQISREQLANQYVYVSSNRRRAEDQMTHRMDMPMSPGKVKRIDKLPVTMLVEVLLEIIRAGKIVVAPEEVSKRLCGRGIYVDADQVEQVYADHGLNPLKKSPC